MWIIFQMAHSAYDLRHRISRAFSLLSDSAMIIYKTAFLNIRTINRITNKIHIIYFSKTICCFIRKNAADRQLLSRIRIHHFRCMTVFPYFLIRRSFFYTVFIRNKSRFMLFCTGNIINNNKRISRFAIAKRIWIWKNRTDFFIQITPFVNSFFRWTVLFSSRLLRL